ncbi:MAG: ribosome maturation factor RimM [Nitrospirae bacterium]|nr:ribosome maturation factor RimM [Nitrospirota bacterium]
MSREDESLVTIGRVLKEWGLKGELMVLPLTFDPERFSGLGEVAVQHQGVIEWKRLKSVRPHKNNLLLSFEGCGTPEDARKYRSALIKIKKSESPKLPTGVYYQYQIIGLSVYTVKGDYLGEVESIFETGSNDVYVVRGEDKEYLVPAIKDVVKEIDLESKKIIVKPMEAVEE